MRELINCKLDDLQKKMQEYDKRLARLEQAIDDKCLMSSAATVEYDERLTTLEQLVNDKCSMSQAASELNKSLTDELNAVRVESRESLLQSNDNEQYNRRNNLRIHGIAPNDNCRALAVDFIKNVLHLSGIEEQDIEAAHSAFPLAPQATSTTTRRPVVLVRFHQRDHRDKVIRARRNLKGSKYAVTEDLTSLNIKTMNRVKNNELVQNVWSWNGKIIALLKNGKKLLVRPFQPLDQLL